MPGSVTLARVVYSSREYRKTETTADAAVAARNLFSEKLTFQSILQTESDAEDLRDRIIDIRSPGKKNWTLQVRRSGDSCKVGDTITLTTTEFGIGTANFIVKKKRVQLESLYNFLTIYGPL